jgi:hypothetical protein
MTRHMLLAVAFALGGGLLATNSALAQTQTGGATPTYPSAQPLAPPTPPPTPAPSSGPPLADQPVYSVNPPPGDTSGIYLPAVVGGYVKSATSCAVVGCDNGPDVPPPAAGADIPPTLTPANPGPSGPH